MSKLSKVRQYRIAKTIYANPKSWARLEDLANKKGLNFQEYVRQVIEEALNKG